MREWKKRKSPRRASKREHIGELIQSVERWQAEGCTFDEAIGKLSIAQWDALCDAGVNWDEKQLTAKQRKAVKAITSSGRQKFPQGYKKEYPKTKQEIYNSIVAHLEEMGAVIKPREKQNFRDLDFVKDGIDYKIVLSNPRPPKKT